MMEEQIAEVVEDTQSYPLSEQETQELMIYRPDCNKIISTVIDSFKSGIDFAKVAGKKDSLLIPGADKFCFTFQLECRWVKDTDTMSMLDIKNLIAFRCLLIDRKSGKVLGEGRGAAQVGESENCSKPNGAIKMAEIRAKRDAVLNLFPLRERFTQDLEDDAKEVAKPSVVTASSNGVTVL